LILLLGKTFNNNYFFVSLEASP